MKLEERRKLQFQQNIYRISFISFIVVVIWIGFEIYWSYTKTPQEIQINRELLAPLEPNLYIELAEELNQREKIGDAEINGFRQNIGLLQAEPSPSPEVNSIIVPANPIDIISEEDQSVE